MGTALSAGVTGLRAHDQLLDVVGNNLANLNTAGFKSRRVVFRDLIYSTPITASRSAEGVTGGTNPVQIGTGVQSGNIDRDLSQGGLEATGGLTDFAIEGDGYFVVTDGVRNLYTRAGGFSIDEAGFIVDPSNGYRLQRVGTSGESDGVNPGFQTPGASSIRVPFGATIPGEATSQVELTGNLPDSARGPVVQVLTSPVPVVAAGVPATAATQLNALDANFVDYAAGDFLDITGTDSDGSTVSTSVAVDGTSTLGDVLAAVNSAFTGGVATLDSDGNLVVTANETGENPLRVEIADAAGNTGNTTWAVLSPVITTEGQGGDTFQNSLEIYDERGGAHTLALTFQKVGIDEWSLSAAIDEADGTVIDGQIDSLLFNEDGSFRESTDSGVGDPSITVQFAEFLIPQSISFNFGETTSFDGLTQLAAEGSLTVDQDGFASGVLTDIGVTATGLLQAESSNGRNFALAQLAIANFRNPQGLAATGGSYFAETPNTGDVQIGPGQNGGRGTIRGGHLETSNVDIASQFTKLIVAQRGFSANARTITVADQLLQELTNLVR